jgi:hypothetical protein
MKLLLYLLLSWATLPALAQRPQNGRLQHELDSIRGQDQRYRKIMARFRKGKVDSLAVALHLPRAQVASHTLAAMHQTDSTNLRRVEEIIWRHGYPGKSLVGSPTNEAAWAVLQHSDKIPQYLVWVQGAAEAGEIPYPLYAQMLDRKLMDDGEEQLYGTQTTGYTVLDHATGRQHTIAFIWPIKDLAHVDKRRRQAGFTTTLAQSAAARGFPAQPATLEYALWLQKYAAQLAELLR